MDFMASSDLAQLAGAVEYADSFSAEEWDSANEYLRYDTKQSDGQVPLILSRMWRTPSLLSLPDQLWMHKISVLSMG